jgi:hypothetical protein
MKGSRITIIVLAVLLALAVLYIIKSSKKIDTVPVQVFKPDTNLIKQMVYLKADLAIKTTQLEEAQKTIKNYEYKKPPPINGNDSDLTRAYRAILSKIR